MSSLQTRFLGETFRPKNYQEPVTAKLTLGARTLVGAPGIATKNKKLLGAPGLTTRSKDATRSKGHRY